MIEYGNGIAKGPAGQVGGGSHPIAAGGDAFAHISQVVNDGVAWVTGLSTLEQVALLVAVVLGLVLLRRALF